MSAALCNAAIFSCNFIEVFFNIDNSFSKVLKKHLWITEKFTREIEEINHLL